MIRYSCRPACLMLCLVSTGLAPHVHAQDMPYVDAVGPYVHSQIMRHRSDADSSSKQTSDSIVSPDVSVSRHYAPSAAGGRLSQQAILGLWGDVNPPMPAIQPLASALARYPKERTQMAAVFAATPDARRDQLANGQLRISTSSYLSELGANPADFVQVQHALMVEIWCAAQDVCGTDRGRAILAMNRRLEDTLKDRSTNPPTLPPIEVRQALAESMAMLALSLRRWSEQPDVGSRKDLAHALGIAMGFDVEKLTLTSSGFHQARTKQ